MSKKIELADKEKKREYDKNRYIINKVKLLSQAKKYKDEHKDKIANYQKQHYAKHKKERSAYYKANIDKIKIYMKAYGEANKDKKKLLHKAYCDSHKEELRIYKKAYNKAYSKVNKDKIKTQSNAYYLENKDKIKIQRKIYREKNKKKVAAQAQKYRRTNKDKVNRRINIKRKQRRKIDVKFRLNANMSNRVGSSLREGKGGRKWEEVVGYTFKQLKKHLEKLFLPDMSWDNYGKWHVDHLIPIAVFNFTNTEHRDFKRCWALSNLQPLWAKDNLSKQAKLTKPFQPSLLF